MHYLAIGVAGFLIIHISDPAAIKKLPIIKPLAWFVGMALLLFSLAEMWLTPNKMALPDWSTALGWAILSISTPMVVYALFVNLPFRKTYITKGVGKNLIDTGFYAVVRHPGVPWFVLFLVSVVLASRSRLILLACPILIILDIAVVTAQDRVFFPRMFPGYEEYRRQTPMLIPTRKSIRAFLNWTHRSRQIQPVDVVSKQKEATHVHLS